MTFIFTTTQEEELLEAVQDAKPLLSRCHVFNLTDQGLSNLIAKHGMKIAEAEGLGGLPLKEYEKFVNKKKGNNFRTIIQAVEAGAFLAEDAAIA